MKFTLSIALCLVAHLSVLCASDRWRFAFGDAPSEDWIRVGADDRYTDERGYGFEHKGDMKPFAWDAVGPWTAGLASAEPFVFSTQLPEGNYSVTVWLAGLENANAPVTVRSESRRLMVMAETPEVNDVLRRRFTVNVRRPELDDGGEVSLKSREQGAWHWDDRLQLEFNGDHTALLGIEIALNTNAVTLFLAGDSTVTDQVEEPWTGWGQMLPHFFNASVAVANHAESGKALRSFRAAGRLDKILQTMRQGDYLFIQFGHNDQKEAGEGIGPWDSYADDLRAYIDATRERGGNPVVVTSMKRRRFDSEGRQYASLGDYPLAARRVAVEKEVPLIDLNLMSGVLYSALGPEGSTQAFVHYPAGTFPGQEEALRDNSHFSPYGGYQLARCVVLGIELAVPELVHYLREGLDPYDPARPDPAEDFDVPPSPWASVVEPEGN